MSYRLQHLSGFQGQGGLPCPGVNRDRHPAWLGQAAGTAEGREHPGLGHRKPPRGAGCAQNLHLWHGVAFPEAELLVLMLKGANATSLCCLLLTGISDSLSCLPDKHFLLV